MSQPNQFKAHIGSGVVFFFHKGYAHKQEMKTYLSPTIGPLQLIFGRMKPLARETWRLKEKS